MKFLIKSTPDQVLVDLKMDIPSIIKNNIVLMKYDDYFLYFSDQYFHLCNFKTIKFSDGVVEGTKADLNLFIWLAMAHQGYIERKLLLSKEYIEDLEQSISSIFDRDLEAIEWYMAIHRSIDLYIKSNVNDVVEFLPANIVPLNEITDFLKQLDEDKSTSIEKCDMPSVVYS
ncbi:hypothetical protein [Acinetobacter sp. YH01009]|uniref:hypothetical protein n=1 Tax=Acinetobacter TaxID=469 RepID=UPI0015D45F35|nr:hypothetical protein [Acinetobacter sp. YH01009]